MKKLLFLAMASSLALTACSGSNKTPEPAVQPVVEQPKLSEVEQLLQSVQFTDEGIKKLFKSETEMTPVEYEAYLLSYSKCSFDNNKIGDKCPPDEIYIDVRKRNLDREEKNKVHFKLMDSKQDIVRYVAARDLDVYPNETDLQKQSLELCKKEKNGRVLASMMRGIHFMVPQSDEAREFVVNQASHESYDVREMVAQTLSQSEVLEGHPELLDTLMTLCTKDSELSVSFYACQGVGRLHDDSVVPEFVEILNDPEQFGRHTDITRALVEMWLNFPNYEHTSKDAYTAYINYLKKKPRSDAQPAPESLRINSLVDTTDEYKAWQKQAKYFKLKDMISVYSDIAKDDNANISARKVAIEMITDWGTIKDLNALSKSINASKADRIEEVQEQLQE
ncbi:MAG: HEAT repeat domain-containing protein, partial [Proteobacteria bacterium]|nr:HEAT repeat domain-containing protein [Pseudomonadota bacterium]